MKLEPWLIASWPIVQRPCSSDIALGATLVHLGTTVSPDNDDFGRLLGNTFWGTRALDIGVAWDWTEAHDEVFAVSDPMGIVSNIQFTEDASAEPLSELPAAVRLNRIAHGLHWQEIVAKVTQELRTSRRRQRKIENLSRRDGHVESWASQYPATPTTAGTRNLF